jgi:acyl carrier protein
MNTQLLIKDMAKLFELDKHMLKDSFLLVDEANWDSLSVVSLVAAIDQHYHVSVTGSELMNCITIKDIFSLIELRLK